MPGTEQLTDSYSLAVQWVRDSLHRETFEQHLEAGDEIGVIDMQNCDCIPLAVRTEAAGRDGDWRLVSVEPRRRGLMAIYKFDGESR